jgi:ribonuclease P protein component
MRVQRAAALKNPKAIRLPGHVGIQDDSMQKTIALTENRDFRRLYKKGKSFVTPLLVAYVSKNRLGVNRVGITTGRKIGKAVVRNRARRVIREAYRLLESKTGDGWDFVFVARGRTAAHKTGDVLKVMEGVLTSAGVIKQ